MVILQNRLPAGPWPERTLLDLLPRDVGQDMLNKGPIRTYTDRPLVVQGGLDRAVYVLVSGLVKVSATAQNGVESVFGVRIAGDPVGEMAVLSDRVRSATVTACGKAIAVVIPGDVFLRLVERHAVLGLALSRIIGDRLSWANQIRLDSSAYEVGVRVARALIYLVARHGQPTEGGLQLEVPLTQAELGAVIGAREVTVQKALRELEASGFLSRGRRRVVVRDPAALSEFADLEDLLP